MPLVAARAPWREGGRDVCMECKSTTSSLRYTYVVFACIRMYLHHIILICTYTHTCAVYLCLTGAPLPFLGRALHGGSHGHQDAAVTTSLLSFLTGQILKIALRWHRVLGNIENYNHQLLVLWYFMIFYDIYGDDMEMTEMMVVGKTSRRVFYDVLWGSAQVKWVQIRVQLRRADACYWNFCFWRCCKRLQTMGNLESNISFFNHTRIYRIY